MMLIMSFDTFSIIPDSFYGNTSVSNRNGGAHSSQSERRLKKLAGMAEMGSHSPKGTAVDQFAHVLTHV